MVKNPFIASINDEKYLEFIDTDISSVLSKKTWRNVITTIHNAKRILDVGCGVGTLLYNLKQECQPEAQIIGLTKCKKHCHYAKTFVKGAIIINGEALKTPFKDSSIPLIFSTMLIEHLNDQSYIQEIFRILENEGTIVLSTVLKKRWAYYFYKNDKGERVLAPDHVKEYKSPKELISLLNKYNLIVKEFNIVPIRFSFIDFLFHSLYRLTENRYIENLSEKKFITLFRKITRVHIPGFFALEVIAFKKC